MAEMAEIFPLFRYYSVSSVIDKDNSQSDWRECFYNGRNGNYRNRRTSENRVILVWSLSSEEEEDDSQNKRKRLCIPYQIVFLG